MRHHVILGYLEAGQIQKAICSIVNSNLISGQLICQTADQLRVSELCALMIGKMLHAAERGIQLNLAEGSCCIEQDLLIPVEDMVTVMGNLLENAIEELSSGEHPVKEIEFGLYCRPDCSLLVCTDTGGGISPEVRSSMNYLDYDAWTLGNHEFSFGFNYVQKEIKEFKGVTLAGNIYQKDGSRWLNAYQIFDVNGVKVAVFGIDAPHIPIWEKSDPTHYNNMLRRADAYNENRERLFQLEREGRAIIIAPESTKGYSRTEKDVEKIRALWQDGYFKGRAAVPELAEFWKKD